MDIDYCWRDEVDEDWKSLAAIVITECTSFRNYKPEYKRNKKLFNKKTVIIKDVYLNKDS